MIHGRHLSQVTHHNQALDTFNFHALNPTSHDIAPHDTHFDYVGAHSDIIDSFASTLTDSHQSTAAGRLSSQSPRTRYTYRDIKGSLREIWQPGDGDGLREGEFPGASNYIERFRFLQHDLGKIVLGRNEPPKYVVLDDKAVHDILQFSGYNAKDRAKYWSHDFSTQGTVKHGRPNRGRPALVPLDEGGEEIDRGDSCGPREIGRGWVGDVRKKQRKYHFTGERNGYTEVHFEKHVMHPTPSSQPALPQHLPPETQLSQSPLVRSPFTQSPNTASLELGNGMYEEKQGNHTAERDDDQRDARGGEGKNEDYKSTFEIVYDEGTLPTAKRVRLNTYDSSSANGSRSFDQPSDLGNGITSPHLLNASSSASTRQVPTTNVEPAHRSYTTMHSSTSPQSTCDATAGDLYAARLRVPKSQVKILNRRNLTSPMSPDVQIVAGTASSSPSHARSLVATETSSGSGRKPMWQAVKELEERLDRAESDLRSKDEEIRRLEDETVKLRVEMVVDQSGGLEFPEAGMDMNAQVMDFHEGKAMKNEAQNDEDEPTHDLNQCGQITEQRMVDVVGEGAENKIELKEANSSIYAAVDYEAVGKGPQTRGEATIGHYDSSAAANEQLQAEMGAGLVGSVLGTFS